MTKIELEELKKRLGLMSQGGTGAPASPSYDPFTQTAPVDTPAPTVAPPVPAPVEQTASDFSFESIEIATPQPEDDFDFGDVEPIEPTEPTILDELGRQIALTGRSVTEGLGSLAGVVVDPINAVKDLALGTTTPPLREATSQILDSVGVAEPENATEEIVGAIVEGVSGGGAVAAAAKTGAKILSNQVGKGVASVMAQAPGIQAISGGTSLGAATSVEQLGGGQGLQIAAALLGAIVPSVAPSILKNSLGAARELGTRLTDGSTKSAITSAERKALKITNKALNDVARYTNMPTLTREFLIAEGKSGKSLQTIFAEAGVDPTKAANTINTLFGESDVVKNVLGVAADESTAAIKASQTASAKAIRNQNESDLLTQGKESEILLRSTSGDDLSQALLELGSGPNSIAIQGNLKRNVIEMLENSASELFKKEGYKKITASNVFINNAEGGDGLIYMVKKGELPNPATGLYDIDTQLISISDKVDGTLLRRLGSQARISANDFFGSGRVDEGSDMSATASGIRNVTEDAVDGIGDVNAILTKANNAKALESKISTMINSGTSLTGKNADELTKLLDESGLDPLEKLAVAQSAIGDSLGADKIPFFSTHLKNALSTIPGTADDFARSSKIIAELETLALTGNKSATTELESIAKTIARGGISHVNLFTVARVSAGNPTFDVLSGVIGAARALLKREKPAKSIMKSEIAEALVGVDKNKLDEVMNLTSKDATTSRKLVAKAIYDALGKAFSMSDIRKFLENPEIRSKLGTSSIIGTSRVEEPEDDLSAFGIE